MAAAVDLTDSPRATVAVATKISTLGDRRGRTIPWRGDAMAGWRERYGSMLEAQEAVDKARRQAERIKDFRPARSFRPPAFRLALAVIGRVGVSVGARLKPIGHGPS